MKQTDLNILEAMYIGNHLNENELNRAEHLIFIFALYLKNNGNKLEWMQTK
jgi:hypothetical protein